MDNSRSRKSRTLLPVLSLSTAALVTTGIALSFQPVVASGNLSPSGAGKQEAKQKAVEKFAKVGFRPVNANVAKQFTWKYPTVANLFSSTAIGSWDAIQKKFFAGGEIFDQIQR
jgi:hypothetical protein